MLPTYKRRQIARKIFRDVRNIVGRSHALHETERPYELPELWLNAVAMHAVTFDRCCFYNDIC
jgi:hypothetical protein